MNEAKTKTQTRIENKVIEQRIWIINNGICLQGYADRYKDIYQAKAVYDADLMALNRCHDRLRQIAANSEVLTNLSVDVYKCSGCKKIVASITTPTWCNNCGHETLDKDKIEITAGHLLFHVELKPEPERSELDNRLSNIHWALLNITKNCRDDMHEPDEQGISANIVGYKLDNACGNVIEEKALFEGWQEYVVILRNDNTNTNTRINLADLIALARKAKL